MGVQKSRVLLSNYKKKSLFFVKRILNCKKKKKVSKKYCFFLNRTYLIFYTFHLNFLNLTEFFLQTIIIYNSLQILKNNNFYYVYFYFLINLIYICIFLITYDMDLNSIILLIIYGGLMIIFLVYSIMWLEIFKNFYKLIKFKNNLVYFIIMFFTFIYYVKNTSFFSFIYFLFINSYINFYQFNSKNLTKELEILGWGLLYYTSFIFLIISYFLFLNCLVVVTIINNSKKLKNNFLGFYFVYFLKNKNLFFFNIIKSQYFFIQDYENIYQKNTLIKNFKIINHYHQVKVVRRRV